MRINEFYYYYYYLLLIYYYNYYYHYACQKDKKHAYAKEMYKYLLFKITSRPNQSHGLARHQMCHECALHCSLSLLSNRQ